MSRHDEREPVVFDLVEDNGPDAGPGEGPDAADVASPDSPDRRPSRLPRLPRLSRRTWLVAAAAVTVVVVTVAAVDLVRDQRRADLMRTSSVGVASLAYPPEEVWTVPFDVPATVDQSWFMSQQLVIMDGRLVVPPGRAQSFTVDASDGAAEPAPVGFEDVVAVDPGSGEVAWRVAVGERPVCGPVGYDASISTDTLVCVHGPENEREVLTIAPDGSTRSRAADLAEGEQVFPAPDGMVVRVARIGDAGDAAEQVECNSMGACTPAVLTEGRDVLVTAEDAETGTERWTRTIAFAPVDASNCQQYDGMGEVTGVDPDQVTVHAGARMVDVDGCGIRGTLSALGVRLDLAGGDGSGQAWVTELGKGAFGVGAGTDTVVVDEAGKTLRTLSGWVQTGAVSPDAPDDLWFVADGSGFGFDAVREDGSVAWTDKYSGGVLLVARDVVVVDRGNKVAGLDRVTGAELWTWSGEHVLGLARYRTLTDGETVALEHLPQESSGEGLLVALDLDTGEQLWDAPLTNTAVAVDGHIVEITLDGVVGRG
ncbi:putative pyrroloquinoline-quinone binding quinoprotein [Promicromonospora sp. AC04]|uniref:outer membrane protein assembly factor BamB family protein n=1 Tax=Promicromonospora sp. AC04 TaxID=2135723 RepID=UPI000D34B1B8|nr:PQQ-binding-like beta-propeller repeat protein [Promicromonospora sp. AC04]PUB28962.1 putative pyrroloquinoline-quinone binding quinoprotein [Promicromonospora sp. AC04]